MSNLIDVVVVDVALVVVFVLLNYMCVHCSLSSSSSHACRWPSNGLLGIQFGGVPESTTQFLTMQPGTFC